MGFIDSAKKFVLRVKSDGHVPIALFVFVVTFAYHAHSGKDLGTNFTNSIYAFYGFLTGHGFTQAKWGTGSQNRPEGQDYPAPDPPSASPPA